VVIVDRQLRDKDTFLAEIKDRLLQAQDLLKTTHDKHHRELEFVVGDCVWLFLNQHTAINVCKAKVSREASKSKAIPLPQD
jgi:hypothetical protein